VTNFHNRNIVDPSCKNTSGSCNDLKL